MTSTKPLTATDKKDIALESFSLNVAYTWLCSVLASVLPTNPPQKSKLATQDLTERLVDKSKPTTPLNGDLTAHVALAPVPAPTPSKRKVLILDLDETLVHSTLKPVSHHHFNVDVLIDNVSCKFYVIKRPHVDTFLRKVAEWYDVVIFTASMQQYADPLIDQLDTTRIVKGRLFRESCLNKDGNFIKDLGLIKQDLPNTIIIDNSPIAYSHNKENALPIDNWMGDNPADESLLNMLPFLNALRFTSDVRSILSLRT